MRITIIGAGAMGTLFGALLADAGAARGGVEVRMLDRSRETVDAIRRYGLRVSEPEADGPERGTTAPEDRHAVPEAGIETASAILKPQGRLKPSLRRASGEPFQAEPDQGRLKPSLRGADGEAFQAERDEGRLKPSLRTGRGWTDSTEPGGDGARGGSRTRGDGRERTVFVAASTNPAEVAGADVALVLVKSGGTAWAAEMAARVLAPDGLALTLQNGLGNRERLAARLGPERAWQGVTAQGATLLEPGRVRHAGRGPTHLETRPGIRARAAEVAGIFRKAGIETELSADLAGLIWGKLVVNAGINALTAILRTPNGALAEIPEARTLMLAAANEAGEVARAKGIRLPYASIEERVLEVCRATAANRSSMLQDVLRGRPTEADAINGAIVAEARRLGLAAPVNEMLAGLVRALEQSVDKRIPFNQEGA